MRGKELPAGARSTLKPRFVGDVLQKLAQVIAAFAFGWQPLYISQYVPRVDSARMEFFELLGSEAFDSVQNIQCGEIFDGNTDSFLNRGIDVQNDIALGFSRAL